MHETSVGSSAGETRVTCKQDIGEENPKMEVHDRRAADEESVIEVARGQAWLQDGDKTAATTQPANPGGKSRCRAAAAHKIDVLQ